MSAALSPLAIVGTGLATAVGSSALATVAALRAGVARFREVPEVEVVSRDFGLEPVVAARSPLHRDGSTAAEVERALLDAARADAERWAHSNVWDVTPAATPAHLDRAGVLYRADVLDRLIALAERPENACVPQGLAVSESLATARALARVAETGRLKSSAAPSGFTPGEAGATLVVQRVSDARSDARTVLAVIEGWGRGHEAVPLGGTVPSSATGLTDALADALARLPPGSAPGLVVADLNGERGRALEWALAAPRVLPFQHSRLPMWTPTDGVGECGRATGALLVACAALALAYGWAGGERVLVVTSDDDGARRAIVLRGADRVGPPGA